MKHILAKNKYFILPYLLWLLSIGLILALVPKATIHLTINKYNSPGFDIYFKYFTHLGDGWVFVTIALILLFWSVRKAILVLASGCLSGLVAQFFKRFVFDDMARPVKYLENYQLHLIDGIKMLTHYSFPSGHATSIFALCFALATLTSSMFNKIVLFCIAVAVAFSRIYLSQHFLMDIYAGSIIGIISALIVVYYLNKQKADWLDKSLPDVLNQHRKG